MDKFITKLKILYKEQNLIPKLIEDEFIPEQRIDDYYVKLQTYYDDKLNYKPIEIEQIFDSMSTKSDIKKVLISGVAGVGKSTMLQYISYKWGQDKILKDRFHYLFKVKLKKLLDYGTTGVLLSADEENRLAILIKLSIEDQIFELKEQFGVQQNDYNLTNNKTIEQLKGIKLQEIHNALKGKVLLLLDGYDEIAHLNKGKNNNKLVPALIYSIFERTFILSSRPNAISDRTLEKFDRKIVSTGLDQQNTNAFIDVFFSKQSDLVQMNVKQFYSDNKCQEIQIGQDHQKIVSYLKQKKEYNTAKNCLADSKEFRQSLFKFQSIKALKIPEAIRTPINLVMLCLISSGERFFENFQNNFSAGQLYQESVLWLCRRHRANIQDNKNDETEITINNMFQKNLELVALKKIAYEEFKNGSLLFHGSQIDEIASKQYHNSGIKQVYEFGLLKSEGVGDLGDEQEIQVNVNFLNKNYSFIHLSFQEYLTATYLKEQLGSSNLEEVKNTAKFIGQHRNEPKYLMTLKFLSGLIANSKEDQIINAFWEAAVCNIDGVLDLGVDTKIELLMNLLIQAKIQNNFDPRIPNLKKIEDLINNTVLSDIIKWKTSLISSKYITNQIANQIKLIINDKNEIQLEKIQACLDIAINFLDTKQIWKNRQEAFEQINAFFDSGIQHKIILGLDSIAKIIDASSFGKEQLNQSAAKALSLIANKNFHRSSLNLLMKIISLKQLPNLPAQIFSELSNITHESEDRSFQEITSKQLLKIAPYLAFDEQVYGSLIPLLQKGNLNNLNTFYHFLGELVKANPQKSKEAIRILIPLVDPSNDGTPDGAAISLGEIALINPQLAGQALHLIMPLFFKGEYQFYARVSLVNIIQADSRLLSEAFNLLYPKFYEGLPEFGIRHHIQEAIIQIVQKVPTLFDEVLKLVTALLSNKKPEAQANAVNFIGQIVYQKADPQLAKEAFKMISTPSHANEDIQCGVSSALGDITKVNPELATEALKIISQIFFDNYESKSCGYCVQALEYIAETNPKSARDVLNLLDPLISSSNNVNITQRASYYIIKGVVKGDPQLANEALNLIKYLLPNYWACLGVKQIVQADPQLSEKLFNLISLHFYGDQINHGASSSILIEIVKLNRNLLRDVIKLIPHLLSQEHLNVSEALKYMIPLFSECEQLRNRCSQALKIISLDQFIKYKLLEHNNLEVMEGATQSLQRKLSDHNEIKQITYKQINELAYCAKINQILRNMVNEIYKKFLEEPDFPDDMALKWINDNFISIPVSSSNIVKKFLEDICHRVIGDQIITLEESKFIINCIKFGMTFSVTREGDIIFQGVIQKLSQSSKIYLNSITKSILQDDQGLFTQQYRSFQPIFNNSALWLQKAASDFNNITSLVSKNIINSNRNIIMSFLKLENNQIRDFILVETRNEFGDLVIYKIKDSIKLTPKTVNPDYINRIFKENIFGKLQNLRYYIKSIEITQIQFDSLWQELYQDRFLFKKISDIISIDQSKFLGINQTLDQYKKQANQIHQWQLLGLNIDSQDVKLSMLEAKIDLIELNLQQHEDILEKAGVKDEVAIQEALESFNKESPELALYYKTFYWTLTNYFQAYRVSQIGLMQENQDFDRSDYGQKIQSGVKFALQLGQSLPIIGSFESILDNIVDSVFSGLNGQKLENKKTAINNIIKTKLNSEEQLGKTIQKTAIDIIKLKKQSILDPVFSDEESKIQKIQNFCTEKFDQLKGLLFEEKIVPYDQAGGKTADIPIKDVVSLLTYLYIHSEQICNDSSSLSLQFVQIVQNGKLDQQMKIEIPLTLKETDSGCCLVFAVTNIIYDNHLLNLHSNYLNLIAQHQIQEQGIRKF